MLDGPFAIPRFAAVRPMALILCLIAPAGTARADLKVVSESRVTGFPSAIAERATGRDADVLNGRTTTSTVYFKGEKSRTEDGASVILTTRAEDGVLTVYTLDTVKKTYSLSSPLDALRARAENPLSKMLKFETKVFLNPGTDARTVASKMTKDYRYQVVFKMRLVNPDSSLSAVVMTATMRGEEWVSESVSIPSSDSGVAGHTITNASITKNPLAMSPMFGTGFQELADKLAQIKGYPMRSTLVISFDYPPDSPANQMADLLPQKPLSFTTEVKSISEEPLPDDLFTLPADFRKVEAPSALTTAPPAI